MTPSPPSPDNTLIERMAKAISNEAIQTFQVVIPPTDKDMAKAAARVMLEAMERAAIAQQSQRTFKEPWTFVTDFAKENGLE